jgi:hypothetical protein
MENITVQVLNKQVKVTSPWTQWPAWAGLVWEGGYNNSKAYNINDSVEYNGSSYVCISGASGIVPTTSWYWDLLAQSWYSWAQGTSWYSGYSWSNGQSGFSWYSWADWQSGFSGYSWANWASWYSGLSGYSWFSGYSGIDGQSGFSWYSGIDWVSGYSGFSWFSGFSGIDWASGFSWFSWEKGDQWDSWFSWANGESWFSGFSWFSWFSWYSGIDWTSGLSGFSGYSGIDWASGFSGFSWFSGIDGQSWYSGYSWYSGQDGIIWADWASGFSGYSWYSGLDWIAQSGASGYSGYSGTNGASGFSGYSGQDWASGTSWFSWYSWFSGQDWSIWVDWASWFSGYSGASWISGYSWFSWYSGINGSNWTSWLSGYSGFSWYSGTNGSNGASGLSGFSWYSWYSGIGTSWYSGFSGYSWAWASLSFGSSISWTSWTGFGITIWDSASASTVGQSIVIGNTQTNALTALNISSGSSAINHIGISLKVLQSNVSTAPEAGGLSLNNYASATQAVGNVTEVNIGRNFNTNSAFYVNHIGIVNPANAGGGINNAIVINNAGGAMTIGTFAPSSYGNGPVGIGIQQSGAAGTAFAVYGGSNVNSSTNGLVNYTLSNTQSWATVMQKIDLGTSAQGHTGIYIEANNVSSSAYWLRIASGAWAYTWYGISIETWATWNPRPHINSDYNINAALVSARTNDLHYFSWTRNNRATSGTIADNYNNAYFKRTSIQNWAWWTLTSAWSVLKLENVATQTAGTLTDTVDVLKIIQDADSTWYPLSFTQNAVVSTNYRKIFTETNTWITFWMGNGNTANGTLSGTAGDILINGGSNKPEYCTGSNNWTALV